MVTDSPYDFHLRTKHDFYRSLLDGEELHNAAANYQFSKMNAIRHNVYSHTQDEHLFTQASFELLKATRERFVKPFRKITSEQSGLSSSPWIKRLQQYANGHTNPRNSHSQWPAIEDSDTSVSGGSMSPWDVSPYMENSGFGRPAWLDTLSQSWKSSDDGQGNMTNYHKQHLEPAVHEHEKAHSKSWHNKTSHLGSINTGGSPPSDIYRKHFWDWLKQSGEEVQNMNPLEQRDAHLAQYKKVWAGKEPDPMADPSELYDNKSHALGFLGYALGLEWLKPHERDEVIQHLSKHGFDESSKQIPHMSQGWLTRNWMGRYGGTELMHRLRGMDSPGSTIPPSYYDPHNAETKDGFLRRRYMEGLKDVMVYAKDNPALNVKAGDIPYGRFTNRTDENPLGDWKHDEMHEDSHPLYDRRTRGDDDPQYIGAKGHSQTGTIPLVEWVKQQNDHVLPRHTGEKGEDGKIIRPTLSNDHNIHEDWAFQSMQEFEDYLSSGVLDENQHFAVKDRGEELNGEYERRQQVMNALGPYLNMIHHLGGDPTDMRMGPYGLFQLMHQASGGHGDDPLGPISELHHMFHPDTWGNPEGDGLFTTPDKASKSYKVMGLSEGDKPQFKDERIWPRKQGLEGEDRDTDIREESDPISLKIEGDPRTSMHSILGFMGDQPVNQTDYGGTANIMSGYTQHWPQLADSHDPQYHHEYSRSQPLGPLGISKWNSDEDGLGITEDGRRLNDEHYNRTRSTLGHMMSPGGGGRADSKRKALLTALWLRFNEHPADAGTAPNVLPGMTSTGGVSGRISRWQRDLEAYGREHGIMSIPGNPDNKDLSSRVQQFLIHADIGREASHPQPLALDQPASQGSYAGGIPPGEQMSEEDIGWLQDDDGKRVEPGKWYLYGQQGANNDEGKFIPSPDNKGIDSRNYHPEMVNWGGAKGERPHRFEFPFRQDAINAQHNGKAECPVCNGDGRIDAEDVAKAEKPDLFGQTKPDLFGGQPKEQLEVGQPCPNCNGDGKHILSSGGVNAIIGPHPQQHKEQLLQSQLEAWIDSPEDERAPEEWYKSKEEELAGIASMGQQTNQFKDQRRAYHASKLVSTTDLLQNAAKSLAEKVQKQFADDGLPDPFAADENGDWSQAHVNALQLWRHANDMIFRAQPKHRDWKNDKIHGVWTNDDGTTQMVDDLHAGTSVYYPHGEEGSHNTGPTSLPLSIYNSQGYRMKYGWKMAPTFGVGFDQEGKPDIMHNNGETSTQREPLLNVPMNHLQSVFPEMQPMTRIHPSAPSATDQPESQKLDEYGDSMAFQLSEDDVQVSTLLKALTNPDIIKEDGDVKPIKAAHRIFTFDDMNNLRGFSGDWVVSTSYKGHRAIITKQGKKVEGKYADGSNCRLSKDMRKGLIEANGDRYILDVIISKDSVYVIDLLEHGHKELYDEPLKDRLAKLREQFESTDAVLIPAPFNTRRTDDDGLKQAIESLNEEDADGVLLRDAMSTYMKGEPRHPKWVLYREEKEMDVIILDRRGRGPYMYRLGVGPINPEKGKSLGNRAVERDGKWFMDVGTLMRERKPFMEGDYVQVRIAGVSHKERNGIDVYDLQPIQIVSESSTMATDSVETLEILTKSHAPVLYPHDVVVKSKTVEIHLQGLEDTVIYKIDKWDSNWVAHEPYSTLNDLSNSDYAVQISESQRPFWEPIVGLTLKGLIKVDFNPRDSKIKERDDIRDDKEEEEVGSHETNFNLKRPKKISEDQILKPDLTKMIVRALTVIDDIISKETATWTGARGMGIALGTPDSAPRGPTEITQDVNTMDYDMRQRDEDEDDKPQKKKIKPDGEPHDLEELLETEEGETGEIRVTADEAVLEIPPDNERF